MLNDAITYLKKGFSVIPVQKDKKPFIKWEPYQKQKPTIEEITTWFKKWPDAMIGLVTGTISELCVIDCDTPEGQGKVDELISDNLVFPVAETPRGGKHYYFKMPNEPLGNNAGAIPGVDFRGEGGYIVAPPSINGTGKGYRWVDGLSIDEIEPPELPAPYINLLNKALVFNRGIRGGENLTDENLTKPYKALQFLTQGTRDNDLFHVANCMIKGGIEPDKAYKVLEILANNCEPPFPVSEIKNKIESVLKRVDKRERNLKKEVLEWLDLTEGYWNLTELNKTLQNLTREEKVNLHVIIHRLKKDGIIEKYGNQAGVYRRVDTTCENIDFLNASNESLNIKWPFELEKLVKTLPKNIIIIAGEPNAGKTAFLLNVAEMNQGSQEVYYFSSEMGSMELKDRLSKFTRPLNSWKVKFLERSSNFADVIRPDAINIIDFLEIHDEFYKVGALIKEVFDKLNKGIAVIAIQKNKGNEYGLGGGRGLEKARLYLSMEPGKIKIVKAKNWTDSYNNPNGLECSFKLVKGCHFIPDKWQRSIK
ncbi:MAG: bifunctional DNA primase/polymerase [Proteobacteria bacterium]|nr:bifunctional DNA primase/polymerase [Pseudomonadota bacterium]